MVEVEQYEDDDEQCDDADGHPIDDTLGIKLVKIVVGLVMQLIQTVSLAHQFLALHQQHLGIIASHQGRHHQRLFLIGFSFENVNGQFNDLITMCGIDVRSVEQRVAHQLDTPVLSRQAVNATV